MLWGADFVACKMEKSKYTTMWGSDSGGKILKAYSSLFQGILAPSKMQFFVCLACLDHFASKKSTCVAGCQAGREGWFSFSHRARRTNVVAKGKSPAFLAVETLVLTLVREGWYSEGRILAGCGGSPG